MLAYLNLRELLGLAEREGLAEDPAYGVFAAEAPAAREAALAVERGETDARHCASRYCRRLTDPQADDRVPCRAYELR